MKVDVAIEQLLREAIELKGQDESPITDQLEVPDIVTFVTDPAWLNRPNLFPRQSTLLKIFALDEANFTEFDYEQVEKWECGFRVPDEIDGIARYVGNYGTAPDLLRRMRLNRAEGRRWFREMVLVLGRRGSKGYLASLCGAYVLWHLIAMGDPQGVLRIDADKQILVQVFGTKEAQARRDLWSDLKKVIKTAPCFQPYVARSLAKAIFLRPPADEHKYGPIIPSQAIEDQASIQITTGETTARSGRGAASVIQMFDEPAHIDAGLAADADSVYAAATPSLDQFPDHSAIIQASSPWQKTGNFYASYCAALEFYPETGAPVNHDIFTLQAPSWDLYEDWELTQDPSFLMTLGGKPFKPLDGPIIAYDELMRRRERMNKRTFDVERRALFLSSSDAYLDEAAVNDMFRPWKGQFLSNKTEGQWNGAYVAHIDTSRSNCNTALVIAHLERDDDDRAQVIIDAIRVWKPEDFVGEIIDYRVVEADIMQFMKTFPLRALTHDGFDFTGSELRLRDHARTSPIQRSLAIYKRAATHAGNWSRYELFKTALNARLIHAPAHILAQDELQFLRVDGDRVDAPSTGPVTTKDVADAIASVTEHLLREDGDDYVHGALAGLDLSGSRPGGVEEHPLAGQFSAAGDRRRNWHGSPRMSARESRRSRRRQ